MMWKEAILIQFNVLLWLLLGGTKEMQDRTELGELVTGPNTGLETFRTISSGYSKAKSGGLV
jgi:hypothetical protein